MMKRIVCSLLGFSVLLISAGCSSLYPKTVEQKYRLNRNPQATQEELRKIGEKAAADILDSLKKKDYKRFMACFVDEYSKVMTPSQFKDLTRNFSRQGRIVKMDYLGSVNKVTFRLLLWRAVVERSADAAAELKKQGKKPSGTPVPEAVVQLIIGKVGEDWKVIGFSIL